MSCSRAIQQEDNASREVVDGGEKFPSLTDTFVRRAEGKNWRAVKPAQEPKQRGSC